MDQESRAFADPVRVGLIGCGRIGTSHATLLARRVPQARLLAVADPVPAAADRLATRLGVQANSPEALLADPQIEAVVITASSPAHADLVEAAARAGKAVFCEKPMALTLADADRAIAAAHEAEVALQVGFNRRFAPDFAAAHEIVASGGVGAVQLMRSLTRDPGLGDPSAVPPWTIYTQTLIHDFDLLLWMNPGASAVSVHATADALIAPELGPAGLLDTAVVVVRFDNGAIASAEASFSAAYGYDVRAEVFGSGGMVTAGTTTPVPATHLSSTGLHRQTARGDVELFGDAYTAELASFAEAVRDGTPPGVSGEDARRALAVALACIESTRRGGPVAVCTEEAAGV